MRCGILTASALAAGLLCTGSVFAQEVVHALSGTVLKVDPQAKTILLRTNDGSEGLFSFPTQAGKTEVDFDRDVKSRVTPVSSFNKTNEQVVVFFYGNSAERTAVGVQDLGPGPFTTVEGTVTNFNKHQHQITVKPATGKPQTFAIDPKAMADSMMGAVPGDKFVASKGDNVRVIASTATGSQKALFIRD